MLFTTDFYWAYPSSGTQTATQAWKFGMDRIYGPFYRSFMIKDRGERAAWLCLHQVFGKEMLEILKRDARYPKFKSLACMLWMVFRWEMFTDPA